jgi:hypothetical protein
MCTPAQVFQHPLVKIIQAERNPHELQSGGMPDESCALLMMSLPKERELAIS